MTHREERGRAIGSSGWDQARTRAKRTIAIGVALVALGIGISGVTYLMASQNPHGGSYLLAWGPVLFGAITVVRGISALRTLNSQARGATSGPAPDDALDG
jgi:hypothetical protein